MSLNRKGALATVFLVVVIDLMGFGIVLPLLPFYASEFHVSAVGIGLLYSIYSLAQLIFSPVWGRLSDKVGRRPVMLLSTFGAAMAYLLFAFSHSFAMLFASRLIAGLMGGNVSTAQAYVADVTDAKERTKGMGLIGAAFGIGFVLGPAIATFLIHSSIQQGLVRLNLPVLTALFARSPYAIPGIFAALLSLLSFIFVLTLLPETAPVFTGHGSASVERPGLFSQRFWAGVRAKSTGSKGQLLPTLLLSLFLISVGHSTLYSAFPLFCKRKLNLPPDAVGLLFTVMGIIAVLIQGGFIRVLQKRIAERRLYIAGCILMTLGLFLIPFARSEKGLIVYLAVMAVGASLNGPTLNSLISQQAEPSEIGSFMGISQGMAALGRVVGPTWGGILFGLSYWAPFLATAGLVFLTVFLAFRIKSAKT